MPDPQAQQAPAAAPPPEIDLSAGLEPKPAPIDLSAGLEEKPQGITQSDVDRVAGGPRTGAIATGLNEAGSDIWGTLKHAVTHPVDTVKGMVSQVPPIAAYNAIQESLPAFHAYEDARSKGASITDALTAASQKKTEQDASRQALMQRVEEFKKQPGAATTRALTEAALLASTAFEGGPGASAAADLGEAAEVPALETAASTASKPGILKQAWHGEKVAQAPARAALESGAKSSATDAGVAAPKTAGQGLRRLMDEPIKQIAKVERGTYDAINRAADTDLKSLHDYAGKLQDALDDPQNIANTDALEDKLKTTQAAIDKGETAALKEGITPADLQKAKAMTQQRYSMETLKQKLFNNEGVVEGNAEHGVEESINVKNAIKEVERLDKPSRYAPEGSPTRLVQALGDKGAQELKQSLYDAQKAGKSALTKQRILKVIGGTVGLGVGQEAVHVAKELVAP